MKTARNPIAVCGSIRVMMRCSLSVVAALVALVCATPGVEAQQIVFQKIILDQKYRSEGVAVADFNGDGKLDIAAGSVYFAAPDWKMISILEAPKAFDVKRYGDAFLCFSDDLNRDGRPDLMVVDFPGRLTRWYENPGRAGTAWKEFQAIKNTNNESPHWIDIDGDGRREMICGSPDMAMVRPGKDPHALWVIETIAGPDDPKIKGTAHGEGVGDVNGDGRNDVVITQGWWEAPADPKQQTWTFHKADFGGRCGQMPVYDFDGDGDNDVLTTSAHGYGIRWHEQTPDGWQAHDIDNSFSQTHTVCLADIDGDGLKDIVTGKRYYAHCGRDPGANDPAVLCWYRMARKDGRPAWTKHAIDDDSGAGLNFEVPDVNGDGKLDVVTSSKKGTFLFLQKPQ